MTRLPAKASNQYPIKWKTTTTKVAKRSVIGQAFHTGNTNIVLSHTLLKRAAGQELREMRCITRRRGQRTDPHIWLIYSLIVEWKWEDHNQTQT